MARTNQEANPHEGSSIFLVPPEAADLSIEQNVSHFGEASNKDHPKIVYEGVRVHEENLLGEKDTGFQIAQQQFGPVRLAHCMRFSGLGGQCSINVAKAYMSEQEAFGSDLADKQSLQVKIARAETRLHVIRA